jgi:archaemetzincin
VPRRGRLLIALGLAACARGEPRTTKPLPEPEPAVVPAGLVPTAASATASTVTASPSATAIPEPPAKILALHLVPLGDVDALTMTQTKTALETHAGVGGAKVVVTIEPAVPLPKSAESTDKGRYRAEKLLDLLAGLTLGGDLTHAKVMGVAELDIVTDKNGNPNWGILGLGAIDGRCSVISTYRMRRKFDKGGGASDDVVRDRLWKISLHELGHTLGLEHCPIKGCIMEDGHGTVKTTDAETELCPSCASKFKDSVEAL